MCRKIAVLLIIPLLCLCMIQPVIAANGVYGDQTGTVPPPSLQSPITNVVMTEDDKALDESLRTGGTATLDLSTKPDAKTELSPAVVSKLVEEETALVVENTGVKLEFPTGALNNTLIQNQVNDENAKVEIVAKTVTTAEQQAIISKTPVGESTGIFTVGSVVVNLSAEVVTSSGSTDIDSFSEPVAVTIDLSGIELTPEEIGQLTGTRLELDTNGNYVTVNLGGTYDPTTKAFTFYTDKFSLYTVMRVENLINISLRVGVRTASANGVSRVIDAEPIIINDRTMVPLRFIGEALGATLEWNEQAKMVTMTKEGQKRTLVIDKLQPGLDAPAIIRNNRTLVPVRYISESFGARVNWIPSTKTIHVIK